MEGTYITNKERGVWLGLRNYCGSGEIIVHIDKLTSSGVLLARSYASHSEMVQIGRRPSPHDFIYSFSRKKSRECHSERFFDLVYMQAYIVG